MTFKCDRHIGTTCLGIYASNEDANGWNNPASSHNKPKYCATYQEYVYGKMWDNVSSDFTDNFCIVDSACIDNESVYGDNFRWPRWSALCWRIFACGDKLYYVAEQPLDIATFKELRESGWTSPRKIKVDGIDFTLRLMTDEEYEEILVNFTGKLLGKPWEERLIGLTGANTDDPNRWHSGEEMGKAWERYWTYNAGGSWVINKLGDVLFEHDSQTGMALVRGGGLDYQKSIASRRYMWPYQESTSPGTATYIRPVMIRDIPKGSAIFEGKDELCDLDTSAAPKYKPRDVLCKFTYWYKARAQLRIDGSPVAEFDFYLNDGTSGEYTKKHMPGRYEPNPVPDYENMQTGTLRWTLTEEHWRRLSTGKHSIAITVKDPIQGVYDTCSTFTKAVGEPSIISATPDSLAVLNSDRLDIQCVVDTEMESLSNYNPRVRVDIYNTFGNVIDSKTYIKGINPEISLGARKPGESKVIDLDLSINIGQNGLNLKRDSSYSYALYVQNAQGMENKTSKRYSFIKAGRPATPSITTPTGTPEEPACIADKAMDLVFTASDPLTQDVDSLLEYKITANGTDILLHGGTIKASAPTTTDYRIGIRKYRISSGFDKCVPGNLYRLSIRYSTEAATDIPTSGSNSAMVRTAYSDWSDPIYFRIGNPPADGPIIEAPIMNYRLKPDDNVFYFRPQRQKDDHEQLFKVIFVYWKFNEKSQAFDIKEKELVVDGSVNQGDWQYTTEDGQWATLPKEGIVIDGSQVVKLTAKIPESAGRRIQIKVCSCDASSGAVGTSNATYVLGSSQAEISLQKGISEDTRFKEIFIVSTDKLSDDAYGVTKYSEEVTSKLAASDFRGKVVGSKINPNIATLYTGSVETELTQEQYNALIKQGDKAYFEFATTGEVPAKMLRVDYHLIEAIEATTGPLPYTSVEDKSAWLLANVTSLTFTADMFGLASDKPCVEVLALNTTTKATQIIGTFNTKDKGLSEQSIKLTAKQIAFFLDRGTGVISFAITTEDNTDLWDGKFEAGQVQPSSDKDVLVVIQGEDARTTSWIKCTPGYRYRILGGDLSRWQYKDTNGTIHWLVDAPEVLAPTEAKELRVTYTKSGQSGIHIYGMQILRVATPKCSISYAVGKKHEIKCLVTNNALDEEPKWEDATQAFLKAEPYEFMNNDKTADHWGLNFKFTIIANDTVGELDLSSIGIMYR